MKKRFVLVLALILLVASTAFAADVKFTGGFKTGYNFVWDKDGNLTTSVSDDSKNSLGTEGWLYLKLADADGFWTLTYKGTPDLNKTNYMKAAASISLDKALAKAGVDMGDVTLGLSIGGAKNNSVYTVYSDPRSDVDDNWGMAHSAGFATKVEVGYAKLGSLMVSFNPGETTGKFDFGAALKVTPVDGVSVAVGFVNNYPVKLTGSLAGNNGLRASALVDVAKLASLKDMSLTVSGDYALWMKCFTGDVNGSVMHAAAVFGMNKFTVSSEFRMIDSYATEKKTTSGLYNKVVYSGIENVGLNANFDIKDFSDASNNMAFGANASYKLGGVTYAAGIGYATSTKSFNIKPTVAIAW